MNSANISSDISLNKSRGNTSLVFGILSIITSFVSVGFLFGIIGLIVGFIDLIKIKKSKQIGKRKIMAGIICSLLGIVISVIFSVNYGNTLLK